MSDQFALVLVNKKPLTKEFNKDNFLDKLYGSDELRKFILTDKELSVLFEKWNQDKYMY